MKKWIAALLAILTLTGCQAAAPAPQEVPEEGHTQASVPAVEQEPAEEEKTVEIPVEIVEPEKNYTEMNLDVDYETRTVEGLVEDTVGYIYTYPVFSGIDGAEAINTYYAQLMEYLENYARETVYAQAAERHTIADVSGTFEIVAADEGLQLGVQYTVSVSFGDEEAPSSFDRTDVFHPDTGLILGTNG